MNHIEEVTEGLMETFRELKAGTIEARDAQELANVAGKIISAYKTRIAYAVIRNDAPMIEGLETTPQPIALSGPKKAV